jgi:hypothetical protein
MYKSPPLIKVIIVLRNGAQHNKIAEKSSG